MEARDVDFELAPVEPTNQLHHLALGSADVEARQKKGDWIRSTSRHSPKRASEVPLHRLPSMRTGEAESDNVLSFCGKPARPKGKELSCRLPTVIA